MPKLPILVRLILLSSWLGLLVQARADFVSRDVTSVGGTFGTISPSFGFEVGEGTAHVEWGDPLEGSFSSFLQFDGYDAAPDFNQPWFHGGQSVRPLDPFLAGTITFRNGSVATNSTTFSLSVDLNVSAFGAEFLVDNHPFLEEDPVEIAIRQTENTGSDVEKADYIYFPDFPELGSFRVFEGKTTSVPVLMKFGSLIPTAFGDVMDPTAGVVVPSIVADPNAPPTSNAVWIEQGDAGGLPATAQVVSGKGPIGSIKGQLTPDIDQDMYRIKITYLGHFGISAFDDFFHLPLQLFLFDLSGQPLGGLGVGVIGFDEEGEISPGSLSGFVSPGEYYLAVSILDNDPINSNGQEIFPDHSPFQPNPNPVGAPGPIVGWNNELLDFSLGPYTIELTGAAFVLVPEPSTLLLSATWVAYALLWRRRLTVLTSN